VLVEELSSSITFMQKYWGIRSLPTKIRGSTSVLRHFTSAPALFVTLDVYKFTAGTRINGDEHHPSVSRSYCDVDLCLIYIKT